MGTQTADPLRRSPGHVKHADNQCTRCGVRSGDAALNDGTQLKNTVQLRTWCEECGPTLTCDGCNNAHRKEMGLDPE